MKMIRKLKNILETNRPLSITFDLVARTLPYRKFICWKANRYISRIKSNRRYSIIIETTNICNAQCIMCPHKKMVRKKELMSDETFALITKKIKEERIDPPVFILNGFGDPLTDRKIFDRIRRLKGDFPKATIKFYTNLSLADESMIDEMIGSGLDEINISFNGFSKINYEKTMGISYEKSLENLNDLIEKKKKGKRSIKIRISMALTQFNEKEGEEFLKYWEDKVDSVSVNKIHTYNNSVKDFSGKNKINFQKPAFPCKYLWNTVVLGVTGEIFLCCLDYEGRHSFGSVYNDDILKMFHGAEFEKIRKKHLENKVKELDMCSSCYTPFRNGVEWLVDELY